MIAEFTLQSGFFTENFSPWRTFLDAPICWLGTLIMAGCLVGCVAWARRMSHNRRLSSHFSGPMLLALLPVTLGIISSFWYLGHLVRALQSENDIDLWLLMGITFTKLALGLGALFSFLSIVALIVIHNRGTTIPPADREA